MRTKQLKISLLVAWVVALSFFAMVKTNAQSMTGSFTSATQHIYQVNKDETTDSDAAIRLQTNSGGTYQDWVIWNREGALNVGFWSAGLYGSTSENEIDDTYFSISSSGAVSLPYGLRLGTGSVSASNAAMMNVFGKMHISPSGQSPTSFSSEYDSDYLLWVEKGVISDDFLIADVEDWPDYVFEEEYELSTIEELEKFIEHNGHLPGIPSEEEVLKNGYSTHDMNVRFLEKIEELTLYSIDQNKRIEELMHQLDVVD